MSAKCCSDERIDGSFFGSDSVAISYHCERPKIILVKVLTEVFSVENLASDVESAGLHVEGMPKRWVIFTLFVYCMFLATRYKKKL